MNANLIPEDTRQRALNVVANIKTELERQPTSEYDGMTISQDGGGFIIEGSNVEPYSEEQLTNVIHNRIVYYTLFPAGILVNFCGR